jgi:hypothetical protein
MRWWANVRDAATRLVTILRKGWIPFLAAALLLGAMLVAARRYVEVRDYAVTVVAGTILFVLLVLLFSGFSAASTRIAARVLAIPPGWLALVFALLAALGGKLVIGDIPHVSDEVAYQFQARSMALGGLAMPEPAVPEAFNFLHLLIDQGKWYGIMNPGWPAFLALGERLGVPWLINPLLGALACLVFAAFFREAGVDPTERRLAVLLMVICPFLIFMSGSYMSHPVNLLLFGVFCWAWVRMLLRGSLPAALVAGAALAANLLVRPVDTAVVTLPFLVQLLFHLRKRPRLLLHTAVVAVIGGIGIAATLAYNQALTGNPMEMPVTRYFMQRNPGEHFGIGFGPQMGTTLHGAEWPGFTPVDAVRITAYRVVEFLKDLYGLPLLVLAAIIAAVRRSWREWGEWRLVLIASGLALVGVYFLHFYHGIAYGSRHYYLAMPAVTLILGGLAARGLAREETRAVTSAGLLALVVTILTFTTPPLVREYGRSYRGVSPAVARAIHVSGITRGIIFVEPGSWSWKSAFPLNRYPLEQSALVFARDRGNQNQEVLRNFPSRPVFYLVVGPGDNVTIRPAETSPP